jgi:5-formyltetrahydrofolate cyclo-ligase
MQFKDRATLPGPSFYTEGGSGLKADLRRELDGRRTALSDSEREAASAAAQRALIESPWFGTAGTVMLYQPIGREMGVELLVAAALDAGKRLALPRCEAKRVIQARLWDGSLESLVRSRFGILEPGPEAPVIPPSELDLIVIQGVGFDRQGYRLGWGGGFYDRYLPEAAGVKVGIGFRVQIVAVLPREGHDVRLDAVATEAGLLRVR